MTSGNSLASPARKKINLDSDISEELLEAIQRAPVHEEIITTVFWVGERATLKGHASNFDSAWDQRWKENFGGLDSPVYRNGFFPARFRPKQNPFYVALPFNDISNPEHVEVHPILQFFKAKKVSRKVSSVCKNQWVQIEYRGRTCYAQWQDVGPLYTNDYRYVFLGEEPRAHRSDMAGLDISPAVRDYFNFKGYDRTSWRFVDESEVPDGPWKKIVTRS
jgi:hypothetical protein